MELGIGRPRWMGSNETKWLWCFCLIISCPAGEPLCGKFGLVSARVRIMQTCACCRVVRRRQRSRSPVPWHAPRRKGKDEQARSIWQPIWQPAFLCVMQNVVVGSEISIGTGKGSAASHPNVPARRVFGPALIGKGGEGGANLCSDKTSGFQQHPLPPPPSILCINQR